VNGSPAQALVVEALHEAFQRAADPEAFPEQLKEMGLDPWAAAKIYCRWEKHEGAQISLDLTRVSPRLEATIRDFATSAAGMLADAPLTLPAQRHYHFLKGRGAGEALHRHLMQGMELAAGGVARRKQTEVATLSPELEKAIRQRRNLVALAEIPAAVLADPSKILTQVGPLLSGMSVDQGAPAAFAIADRFVRLGQWDLAREVFLLMVDRYPAHPLSVDAYRWLIRHNTSGEARRRHELGQFWVLTQAMVRHSQDASSAGDQPIRGLPETQGVAVRQVGFLGDLDETRRWYRGSFDIGARLAAFGPLFASDPSIQFCLQAARRRLGEFDKAKEWYTQFQREQVNGPWRDAAAAELWLNSRLGPSPKPLAFCTPVTARPFLDGDFSDTCWQGLKPLVLHDAAGDTTKEYPTQVRLAYDKDFHYLGLRCEHPAERHVPPVKVRPRDADLGPYDRVSLLLDVDRDYSTYFHLQVDQRGCVSEDCWGDLTWNPRWFVALRSEPTSWQIEAAIPLTELTGDALAVGRVWACNIVRILPGRGVQAWSIPADVQPRPEGMGLLMFMQEPSAPAAATPKLKVP
jgi:hypothetical protein